MAKEYPVEELRKLVDYNPDTGKLYWKVRDISMFSHTKKPLNMVNSWNTKHANKEINRCAKSGYRLVKLWSSIFQAHRVMWALHYDEWPKEQLDHINGIKDDNRICNLREVTNQENAKNRPMYSKNTSGHVGVFFDKNVKKWRAEIKHNRKNIYLGIFEHIEDAIAARKEAEKLYGFHENHGRLLTAAQNSVE